VKILFLPDTGIPDFLQDAVFHGLHELLGDDVVEWPPLPRYRGAEPPAGERYPFAYFDLPPHPGGSLDELVDWADAIVMPSLRDGALPQVRAALGRKPTAFVDGEDHPYVRGIRTRVDLYFKRETLRAPGLLRARTQLRRAYHLARDREHGRDPLRRHVAVAHPGNVIPLPFGIVDTGFAPTAEKTHDVAFLARPTSPERVRLLERLDALGVRVLAGGDLGWHEYMRAISSARIGISVRGLGYDTLRYWEVPYAGAMLLSEEPPIVVPGNFAHGREAVFAGVDALADEAVRRLEHGTDEIAARGRQALLARHTSVHRAQAVLDRLASL
jgi:hypothetical protein